MRISFALENLGFVSEETTCSGVLVILPLCRGKQHSENGEIEFLVIPRKSLLTTHPKIWLLTTSPSSLKLILSAGNKIP